MPLTNLTGDVADYYKTVTIPPKGDGTTIWISKANSRKLVELSWELQDATGERASPSRALAALIAYWEDEDG